MINDKKIKQMISYGIKQIIVSQEEYDNLKEETKKLIKLNNVNINIKN